RIAAAEAEIDHGLESRAMAGIADGLVVEFSHSAEERVGKRRRPAGGLEGLEPAEWGRKLDLLEFGHRRNGDDASAPNDARRLDVFVDEPFDREDELVVERGLRVLRKPAHANANRLQAIEARRRMRDEHRDHTRR